MYRCHAIEEKFMKQLKDIKEEVTSLKSHVTAVQQTTTAENACEPGKDGETLDDNDTIM